MPQNVRSNAQKVITRSNALNMAKKWICWGKREMPEVGSELMDALFNRVGLRATHLRYSEDTGVGGLGEKKNYVHLQARIWCAT